ncbi:MAG: branched-chain amino acid ABC transporter ATP-binding protein [Candidatus Syntropharchaeales archaeon]
MLEARLLNGGYGELQVIFNINAVIKKKRITAIIGPNGSGKSTFLKTLSGLATIYSGEIIYEDQDITRISPHRRAKLGIAYLPQTDNVFSNLTVRENLQIAGYLVDKHEMRERIAIVLDLFPELEHFMNRKAGGLSGGERQFLAIGSALIKRSRILMLDEPTAHLSPKLSGTIFERIVELRDKLDLTIVLVEQNVKRALEIADHTYILQSGQVAFEGGSRGLLERGGVEKYFISPAPRL